MNESRKETIKSDSGSKHEVWQTIADFLTDLDYSLKKSNYPDSIVGKKKKREIIANLHEMSVDIEYSSDLSATRDIEILKRLLEQARYGNEVIMRHQDRVYMIFECYDENQDKWHQKRELGELILTNKAFKLRKKHWRTKKTDWIFYCTIEEIQNVSIDRQSLEIILPNWAVFPFVDTACSSIKIRTDNLDKSEQWEILLRKKPEKDWNDLIGEESDAEVTEKRIKGAYTLEHLEAVNAYRQVTEFLLDQGYDLEGSIEPIKIVGKKKIEKTFLEYDIFEMYLSNVKVARWFVDPKKTIEIDINLAQKDLNLAVEYEYDPQAASEAICTEMILRSKFEEEEITLKSTDSIEGEFLIPSRSEKGDLILKSGPRMIGALILTNYSIKFEGIKCFVFCPIKNIKAVFIDEEKGDPKQRKLLSICVPIWAILPFRVGSEDPTVVRFNLEDAEEWETRMKELIPEES